MIKGLYLFRSHREVCLSGLTSFISHLLTLELVQLYQQIIHVLQVLDLIYFFKFVDEGEPRDEKDMNFDIEVIIKELDLS